MNRVEQAMAASRIKSWQIAVVGDTLSRTGPNFASMAMKVENLESPSMERILYSEDTGQREFPLQSMKGPLDALWPLFDWNLE